MRRLQAYLIAVAAGYMTGAAVLADINQEAASPWTVLAVCTVAISLVAEAPPLTAARRLSGTLLTVLAGCLANLGSRALVNQELVVGCVVGITALIAFAIAGAIMRLGTMHTTALR